MFSKTSVYISLLAVLILTVNARDPADTRPDNEGDYMRPPAAPKWNITEYDEEFYFKDIPMLINMESTEYYFNISYWFLTGVYRGLYEDNSLVVPNECFGEYYRIKLNQYAYLWYKNPFGNFYQNMLPEYILLYQFFYMIFTICEIDYTINEFMVFCWYRGCWPQQWFEAAEGKGLYVLRAVNEAAIVWWEGSPNEKSTPEDAQKKYNSLAEQTGQSLAQIIQDITGFTKIEP